MAVDTKVLAQISYFAGLSPNELESVKKLISSEEVVGEGEMFLLEGEQCDDMFFVTSGIVKVSKRSVGGREQVLNIASKGESLNDVSTFDDGPNAADVVAITPVHLYSIKKKDMKTLLSEYPQIALNVVKTLAGKVRRDSSLVKVLSVERVISRLARVLLRQVAVGAALLPHLTQQDLADIVGTSRVVVNRSLRVMEEKGAIRLKRRRIVITDEEALKKLVGQS